MNAAVTARTAGMLKITAIDALVCSLPVIHRAGVPTLAGVPRKNLDLLLVRVSSDAGLIGWGEAFAHYNAWPATRSALQTLIAPRLIGRNALDINAITDGLRRELHQVGRSGPVVYALSGVEIALWDLAGKALGVPLHRLLGGAKVNAVKCYASLPRYGFIKPLVHDCGEALARGFDAVKIHEIGIEEIRAAAACLAGKTTGFMIDTNCPWSFDEALQVSRRLSDLDITWLEEPIYPPDDYAALAALRKRCGIPIAAGENAGAVSDFEIMLREDAVDYMQPSIAKIGGVQPMRRVFELAADTAIQVMPHSPFFGPALVATLHLCAALAPDALIEVYFLDVARNPYGDAVVPRDGRFSVPGGPGLGCDPDPELLAAALVP